MAQYRLTKKAIILIVVLFLLIGGGTGGYLYWRLTNDKTVAPTDSDASGENEGEGCSESVLASCYRNNCDGDPLVPDVNGFYECCPSGVKVPQGTACPGEAISCGTVACGTAVRCQCCDGTWRNSPSGASACDSLCGTAGYGADCDSPSTPSQICKCDSYEGCGVNCKFPSGTQAQVDAATVGTCGKKMAYCLKDSAGNTKIEIRDGETCWDQKDICKNPYDQEICTNVCEDGAILTPAASASYEVGDVISIRGWAADADGINPSTVRVSINGTFVGNATVQSACAPDNADATVCAAQGIAKKPVIWTYSHTITTTGTTTISAAWEDAKGVTGTDCQASRSITADEEGNPDWEITKTGANVCVVETPGSEQARVDYIITVTNTGDTAGQLTQVRDTLDNKVQSSYVIDSSINPDATVSGNIITWTLTGDAGQFDPNESKEFTYSLLIPAAAFGQYSNTAVGTPDAGTAFSASEVVYVTCGDVPDTGLFDSAISKVALGLVLIGASIMYISSRSSLTDKVAMQVADGIGYVSSAKVRKEIKRRRFEKKVAGK